MRRIALAVGHSKAKALTHTAVATQRKGAYLVPFRSGPPQMGLKGLLYPKAAMLPAMGVDRSGSACDLECGPIEGMFVFMQCLQLRLSHRLSQTHSFEVFIKANHQIFRRSVRDLPK